MVWQTASLADLTTLHIGGDTAHYVVIGSEEILKEAVAAATAAALPFVVIGGGSNILAPDEGYEGAIFHMRIMGRSYTERDGMVMLEVGAGENFDTVVADTVSRGYWGLENLSGIPGTIGATPIQNVGAYGVEVANVIVSVRVYDTDAKTFRTLTQGECQFGYRDSLFKHKEGQHLIVVSVTFALSTTAVPHITYADLVSHFVTPPASPALVREAVVKIRSQKFPDWTKVGTAGSFFKNPIITTTDATILKEKYPELPTYNAGDDLCKVSLGYMLDKVCGLRGYERGNVSLFERQALVLVAKKGATAREVNDFVQYVTDEVYRHTGIMIEREVRTLL